MDTNEIAVHLERKSPNELGNKKVIADRERKET